MRCFIASAKYHLHFSVFARIVLCTVWDFPEPLLEIAMFTRHLTALALLMASTLACADYYSDQANYQQLRDQQQQQEAQQQQQQAQINRLRRDEQQEQFQRIDNERSNNRNMNEVRSWLR
jgi:HD-like signal output (HDOD) protein